MIILNFKKSNSIFEENIQNYRNMANFGPLTCPHCNSSNVIRWGTYERNVIFFSIEQKQLKSKILKVQRIRCKSCGKTHALLPFGIVPYKQFTDEVISKILVDMYQTSIEKTAEKYLINSSVIKKWNLQFKKIHLIRIRTLLSKMLDMKELMIFLNNDAYKQAYIYQYNMCFMQIKLGILGLSPS